MKKYTRILVAITFLLGLGVADKSQTRSVLNITLPFEFVAGKTTLPAGKYIVKRISYQPFDTLMVTSCDTGASVYVNPVAMEDASAYKPNMSFRKVGDQLLLSGIQTEDYVYGFSVSRSVILAATAKQSGAVAISGSGGSN